MNNIYIDQVAYARSLLSVPGHRPDRFEKAKSCGTDAVMLDLEDAVGAPVKPAARRNVREWFGRGHHGVIRVNKAGSADWDEDLRSLPDQPLVVMVPKVESQEDIEATAERLHSGSRIVPIIETSRAVLSIQLIAGARSVLRLIFGNIDLATELGVGARNSQALAYAHGAITVGSSACALPPPMDGPTPVLGNRELIEDAAHASSIGYTGKACVHPDQVPHVNRAFTPAQGDVAWAREVLACDSDGSVSTVNGALVAGPVFERAYRILARHTFAQNQADTGVSEGLSGHDLGEHGQRA